MSNWKIYLFRYKTALFAAVLLLSFVLVPFLGGDASAVNSRKNLCEGSGGVWTGRGCNTPGDDRTVGGLFESATNILLFLIGAVSVIMIIVGGIRYATAAGDQSAMTAAKNTILYAVIGLIIAFVGYAVVRFVIDQF